MVPHVAHRADLDFLLGELVGELEAGHTYVDAGDEPRVERVEGGMLGAELEADVSGGTADDLPRRELGRGLPLAADRAGRRRQAGDFLLAIDGVELTTGQPLPPAGGQGQAGRP